MNKPNVAILGAGNGAFAYAADLKLKGSRTSIYELPEFEKNLAGAKEAGGIWLENRGKIPGVSEGFAPIDVITTDIKEALDGAEIIFVVIPSFGQKAFSAAAAPYLTDGQIIVFCPANFGASIAFKQEMQKCGNNADITIVDAECMMYSGFKESAEKVWVSGYKRGMKAAAFPASKTKAAMEKISQVYPEWEAGSNVVDIGMRNLNMVFHAPITVCNAGAIDRAQEFLFYFEGCSPAVGKVVEQVEAERLQIAEALGLELKPCLNVLKDWYKDSGCKGDTLTEALTHNPVYAWDYAPKSLQHRFLLEDVPFAMIPMESLGKVAGVKTPVTTAIIELACILTGSNLREKARDLKALGLDSLSKDELMSLVVNGQ